MDTRDWNVIQNIQVFVKKMYLRNNAWKMRGIHSRPIAVEYQITIVHEDDLKTQWPNCIVKFSDSTSTGYTTAGPTLLVMGWLDAHYVTPGACLTKAYDVTIQRYRKSHTKIKPCKMHIFAVYGFKIWCEISKVPFEISHQILNPYTAQFAFYKVLNVWRFMIS